MGLGNDNPKIGDLGSNYKYQLKVLQGLQAIIGTTGGGATEATLLMVLAALQSQQEFEQNLVMDLGGAGCPGNCPTYLQVRIWNEVTHTFNPPIYYNAAGALVVPVGPVQIVNPQYVLADMLVQLQAINTDLDVALSTRASEATLLLSLTELTNILNELITINAELANQGVTLSNIEADIVSVDNNISALAATLDPSGGFQNYRSQAVGVTPIQVITSTSLIGWNLINPNATPVYLKFYDTLAAGVTVGVTAVVKTLMIPGSGSVLLEANYIRQHIFSIAMTIACVTGLADASAVAPASPIHVELKYM